MTKETKMVLNGVYQNEELDNYMSSLMSCFAMTGDLTYWAKYCDAKRLRESVITGECINVRNENEQYKEEKNTLGL